MVGAVKTSSGDSPLADSSSLQWIFHREASGTVKEALGYADWLIEPPRTVQSERASQSALSQWLVSSVGRVPAAMLALKEHVREWVELREARKAMNPQLEGAWPAPLSDQEVWGAGVSYLRSRDARQEEAQDGGDVYARVYEAKRPELFYKGNARNVVGHGGEVGIRADSDWDVPEPELAVLFNPALEAVGFTVGLDMSSRSIEGENPLYLPQAKVYNASCALGPGVLLMTVTDWPLFRIRMIIERKNQVVFEGQTSTEKLARSLPELADYLGRSNDFPQGVFLLTGTGIVPPIDFTLQIGDRIRTEISEIGILENTVIQV